ncbi:MAG: sugar ABC transporter ATP-binding protein [Chloroflexi bacterium]|nr:sugar ABC transporter ATP-binding protein [Chloroflexota bacterium]
MSAPGSPPVLELLHIRRAFGGLVALHDATLRLHPGTVHALLGENGAGKSTLIKVLAGVYQPDGGQILLRGESVGFANPAQARDAGVAVIYQEPTLFPDLSIAENIFMGRHPIDARWRRIRWNALHTEVRGLLERVGLNLDPRERLRGLSVADQQLVEVAKALSLNARVMVMDEPTASLTPGEVERLFGIVRQLRAQGVAIVFIGHRLEEIFAVSDQITVLRDGTYVGTWDTADLTPDQAVAHMVGRPLETLYARQRARAGEPLLQVAGLRREGVFADISFEVCAGEIVGLAGLVGAGRTEVARAIFGIDRPDGGTVTLDGRTVRFDSPRAAVRAGLAYVPEDRQAQGLVLPLPIAQNVTLPLLREMTRAGLLQPARERTLAEEYGRKLRLRARSVRQPARDLSGGNQQKVVLSKWLATRPRVLILDEPTRGIDVGAKAEVHRLMGELAASGLAILMISSELPEILAMSDRVLVMREGRLVTEMDHAAATQESIMAAAAGLTGGLGAAS